MVPDCDTTLVHIFDRNILLKEWVGEYQKHQEFEKEPGAAVAFIHFKLLDLAASAKDFLSVVLVYGLEVLVEPFRVLKDCKPFALVVLSKK